MRLIVVRGPGKAGPFELKEGVHIVGREPSCPVYLPSRKVSRKHAEVVIAAGRVTVRDLDSHNGVIDADGRRVAVLPLPPGDRVQVGDFILMLEAPLAPTTDADDVELGAEDLDSEETSERDGLIALTGSAIPANTPDERPIRSYEHHPVPEALRPTKVLPKSAAPVAAPPVVAAPSSAVASSKALPGPRPVVAAFFLIAAIAMLVCAPFGGSISNIFEARAAMREAYTLVGMRSAESLADRNIAALAAGDVPALRLDPVHDIAGIRDPTLLDAAGTVLVPAERRGTSLGASEVFLMASGSKTTAWADVGDGAIEIVAPSRVGQGQPIVGYARVILEVDAMAAERWNPLPRSLAAALAALVAFFVAAVPGWWFLARRTGNAS